MHASRPHRLRTRKRIGTGHRPLLWLIAFELVGVSIYKVVTLNVDTAAQGLSSTASFTREAWNL